MFVAILKANFWIKVTFVLIFFIIWAWVKNLWCMESMQGEIWICFTFSCLHHYILLKLVIFFSALPKRLCNPVLYFCVVLPEMFKFFLLLKFYLNLKDCNIKGAGLWNYWIVFFFWFFKIWRKLKYNWHFLIFYDIYAKI